MLLRLIPDTGCLFEVDTLEAIREHGHLFGRCTVLCDLLTHEIPDRQDPDHRPMVHNRQVPDAMGGHDLAGLTGGGTGRAGDHVSGHDLTDLDHVRPSRRTGHPVGDVALRDQTHELPVWIVDDQASDLFVLHRQGSRFDGLVLFDGDDLVRTTHSPS